MIAAVSVTLIKTNNDRIGYKNYDIYHHDKEIHKEQWQGLGDDDVLCIGWYHMFLFAIKHSFCGLLCQKTVLMR